jgi:hypothetical protein
LSAVLLGYGSAWSVIDAGGIAKFPVLPDVSRSRSKKIAWS